MAVSIPTGATVLVTGGTGFTGKILVRKLAHHGVSLRVIARLSSDRSALQDLDIQWFPGDVFDATVVKKAMRKVEYVFHVAATCRETTISDEMHRRVNVESTQRLACEAIMKPEFKRFIHVSTAGVHGNIEDPPANETCSFKPDGIYEETKAEAETWLHNFAKEKRLPYTVLRPTAIYGPGDTRILKFFRLATKPVFVLPGIKRCLYHLIHVEDLTDVMIRAAMHPDALGEVFIAGNREAVTLEEMGRIITDSLKKQTRLLRLPVWPFLIAANICEMICRPLHIHPPLYRQRVLFFTSDRSFDTRKMRNVLGYKCGYSNEKGLVETAQWYCERGWL